MSSAVYPDDNLEPDFLDQLDEESAQPNTVNQDANPTSFAAGRKLLRDSVYKGANLEIRRKSIIANIAKSKYSQYSEQRSLRMAASEYDQMVQLAYAKIRGEMPDLDAAQARLLAEQEVLKAQGTLKTNAQALASKGGKLAKKGFEKGVKYVGNILLPGLGSVLHFFIFNKIGRIIIVLICLCCFFLIIEVWQTFASEDKWNSIRESANLVSCAGGTDNDKLAKCLFDQKIEEYSLQEPTPE